MKRLLVTIALTCVLSGSALAGDMPIIPAPGGGGMTTEQTPPGDMPTVPVPGDIPTIGLPVMLTILDLMF